MSDFNKKVIAEFRENAGKVGGHFENMDLLLLHTTGAKSGQPRLHPLVYMADGDTYVIIASKGGADTHPAWYYNLVANPDVTVEVGTEKFAAKATNLAEPERSERYGKMAEKYHFFKGYAEGTERIIPVFALTRTN